MDPLFLGSHPAMDFLNTFFMYEGKETDVIADGQLLLRWLVKSELMREAEIEKIKRSLGKKDLDNLAARARELRDWAAKWVAQWCKQPEADFSNELRTLNRWLKHGSFQRAVIADKNNISIIEHRSLVSADELLALLAEQIARLVAEEQPALVKRCAGPGCVLWFLDRTKAHRRVFCSNTACGNRAKVAAYRERQRGT